MIQRNHSSNMCLARIRYLISHLFFPLKFWNNFSNFPIERPLVIDSISSKLLKIAAPVIATSITDLFNCSTIFS